VELHYIVTTTASFASTGVFLCLGCLGCAWYMHGRRGGGRAKWTTLGGQSRIGRERGDPERMARVDHRPGYAGDNAVESDRLFGGRV